MNEGRNERSKEWTKEGMNEGRNEQRNERMNDWMIEWTKEGMNEGRNEQRKEWTKEWTNEWLNDWMNERTNKRAHTKVIAEKQLTATGNAVTTIPIAFIHANTLSRGIFIALSTEQHKKEWIYRLVYCNKQQWVKMCKCNSTLFCSHYISMPS